MKGLTEPSVADYFGSSTRAVEKTQPMAIVPQQSPAFIARDNPALLLEVRESKVHPKIKELIGKDIIVKMINNAFPTSGKLVSATNKMIVINTVIGQNKHNQSITDDMVIMMNVVASIARNPRDM